MAMTIVNNILKQMPAVGQPQRTFLVLLFSTILALRGRVNFRHLSRYCDYSERTIARQFRRSFDWPDFHQRVITTALDPQAKVISAQDASFIPKSGRQTFGLGHFFNGCAGRAERGLEISTLAVMDVRHRCAFTLAVAQTPPTCATATKQDQEAILVDFCTQQLRARHHRLPAWGTYSRKDPSTPRHLILASTDLALDGHKLLESYGARFQIEFLFRDSKQFTGLTNCQARAEAPLSFHFNAPLATLG
jgi:hypothetical protein